MSNNQWGRFLVLLVTYCFFGKQAVGFMAVAYTIESIANIMAEK